MANPMQFGFTSRGTKQTIAKLDRVALSAADHKKVMKEMLKIIVAKNNASFGHGPALSDRTLEDKARYGYPADKLVRTGALKKGVTTITGQGHGIRIITKKNLVFGAKAWYGIFSYAGTPSEPKRYTMASDRTIMVVRALVMKHMGFL